ncbi:malate dehydrogenase [Lasiodiplodia theobromae]|uniref:malate dehydrogenase n=1 Tax=Lasiodiplodia theobromae TaxID=45133 RepID=UPI0015C3EE9D|nr:malate dehydrogenase [Lasiodiplodia theobromae]KAF4538229.1 malate dehydrogenase [Lasiodiplodia theobromae]
MTKVAVLGASGQIGQPLSLLLKSSRLVTELRLYDIVHSVGVATDLNHIDTPAKVSGYLPADNGLEKTLTGAELVIIPAGIARKPGMTRDDLFKTNANVISELLSGVAKFCPTAFVAIITNPVNSTLPIAVEVLKKAGVYNPRKVFGVTTLDVVRASTFLAHILSEQDPQKFKVPVVGGHSGATILPLFSQSQPAVDLTREQLDAITYRVQFGGDEIIKSKAGAGSATTCMAYAGFRFAQAIIKASKGESGIIEEAYVYLPGVPGGEEIAKSLGVEYFAVPIEFDSEGASKALPIGKLSAYEEDLLKIAVEELKGNVAKGESHVRGAAA